MSRVPLKAENFLAWHQLDSRRQTLLATFWGEEAAVSWNDFTVEHDDRAAAFLAVAGALEKTAVFGKTAALGTALDMVETISEIRGDRLLVRLSAAVFEDWRRGGGRFTIFLANGTEENGSIEFNSGDVGGSLHEGYDTQGYTSTWRIPRIHWNYRYADAWADIDLDGYPPTQWEHLTDRNSDVRCWHAAYVLKFGTPGFTVTTLPPAPWVCPLRP
jgi:hypothetical protein